MLAGVATGDQCMYIENSFQYSPKKDNWAQGGSRVRCNYHTSMQLATFGSA